MLKHFPLSMHLECLRHYNNNSYPIKPFTVTVNSPYYDSLKKFTDSVDLLNECNISIDRLDGDLVYHCDYANDSTYFRDGLLKFVDDDGQKCEVSIKCSVLYAMVDSYVNTDTGKLSTSYSDDTNKLVTLKQYIGIGSLKLLDSEQPSKLVYICYYVFNDTVMHIHKKYSEVHDTLHCGLYGIVLHIEDNHIPIVQYGGPDIVSAQIGLFSQFNRYVNFSLYTNNNGVYGIFNVLPYGGDNEIYHEHLSFIVVGEQLNGILKNIYPVFDKPLVFEKHYVCTDYIIDTVLTVSSDGAPGVTWLIYKTSEYYNNSSRSARVLELVSCKEIGDNSDKKSSITTIDGDTFVIVYTQNSRLKFKVIENVEEING